MWEVVACGLDGFGVLSCEDGDGVGGFVGVLECDLDGGACVAGGAATDGVEDEECGAWLFHEGVDVLGGFEFGDAEVGEFLSHGGDHGFGVGHDESPYSCCKLFVLCGFAKPQAVVDACCEAVIEGNIRLLMGSGQVGWGNTLFGLCA